MTLVLAIMIELSSFDGEVVMMQDSWNHKVAISRPETTANNRRSGGQRFTGCCVGGSMGVRAIKWSYQEKWDLIFPVDAYI